MKQRIITARSAGELNTLLESFLKDNWIPVGSHQVTILHIQNRFSGTQHKDSIYQVEYSQTIRKVEVEPKT